MQVIKAFTDQLDEARLLKGHLSDLKLTLDPFSNFQAARKDDRDHD